MRDQTTGRFLKKGEVSIDEATQKAFELQLDSFYLNDIYRNVWKQMRPSKPEPTAVSAVMRRLRRKKKINYSANEIGVYFKLPNVN
jgi:hypothetical protein